MILNTAIFFIIFREVHEVYLRSSITPDDLLARMGEFDTLSTNEPYPHVDKKVQSIFVHPGYNHDETVTKGYDIALIKLADPVDYAINQVPICLPPNNDTLVGEIAWVKGFGRLSDGNYLRSF